MTQCCAGLRQLLHMSYDHANATQIEDLPMESPMLSEALDTAQKRVEAYFFDIRK